MSSHSSTKNKGISWLAPDCQPESPNPKSLKVIPIIARNMHHNHKWKKNTADRFAGFSKIIKKTLEHRLKK